MALKNWKELLDSTESELTEGKGGTLFSSRPHEEANKLFVVEGEILGFAGEDGQFRLANWGEAVQVFRKYAIERINNKSEEAIASDENIVIRSSDRLDLQWCDLHFLVAQEKNYPGDVYIYQDSVLRKHQIPMSLIPENQRVPFRHAQNPTPANAEFALMVNMNIPVELTGFHALDAQIVGRYSADGNLSESLVSMYVYYQVKDGQMVPVEMEYLREIFDLCFGTVTPESRALSSSRVAWAEVGVWA